MKNIYTLVLTAIIAILIYTSVSLISSSDSFKTKEISDDKYINTTHNKLDKNIDIKYEKSEKKIYKKNIQKKYEDKKMIKEQIYVSNDDYSIAFSNANINKKKEHIPLYININGKKEKLSFPLLSIKDTNESKMIIKNQYGDVLGKVTPNFINNLTKDDKITIDIDTNTHKVNAIHIDKQNKKKIITREQVGDLPNFAY